MDKMMLASREVPTAEAALLTDGHSSRMLEIDVELTGPHGPMAVSATIEP
jgi:hypothetical protein